MPASPPVIPRRACEGGPDGENQEVCASIERYYTAKILQYGAIPPGVDWRSTADQELRFLQLLAICDFSQPFSLNDLGCGYGALWGYLLSRHPGVAIDYTGIDLSPAMVAQAKQRWPLRNGLARYAVGHECPCVADYAVASGIFNVRLDQPVDRWERFVARTLKGLHASSRRGFAVNFVASGVSPHRPPEEIYCTRPEPWIAFCERELAASVELRADYGLREFTLVVRRNSAHQGGSPGPLLRQ